MTAAYELRRAGYKVQVLEYNARPGGRNWTVRGGDTYIELGGARQVCRFDDGQYLNPGPWRIPYHHYAVLHYCRLLGVALEPFVQLNHNAYLHKPDAFGGARQRLREIKADYSGGVAELLAKATTRARSTTTSPNRTARSCSKLCANSAASTATSAIAPARQRQHFAAMHGRPAAASRRVPRMASR